jgi:hypothetical protein
MHAVQPQCTTHRRGRALTRTLGASTAVRAVPRLLGASPVRSSSVDLSPVSGKGMWWTTWPGTRFDATAAVREAKAAGLHQIWVRTGGTTKGWYGTPLLDALLPPAHRAGLAVVAWDYPTLSNPAADAARAARAIQGTFGGRHIDAFSPDIEAAAEGTRDSPEPVRAYLSRVRAAAGSMPVIATVLNPTGAALAHYPYESEAPYVDAFAPMVYWSCTEPGAATANAISYLGRLRPVLPIGQAYNMAAEGGRRGLPSAAEVWRFLDVARSHGAIGASLWDAENASHSEWSALGNYPWHHAD